MPKISIRWQQVKDAPRFYEILRNPNFIYFPAKPKSMAAEGEWLRKNPERRRNNTEWNYAILCGGKVVGGIGLKIDQRRKYIGEIGYFLDESYWGKGITSKAVSLVEKEGFNKLGLTRIEIRMQPENKASEKVAEKSGYKKEGLLKKALVGTDGKKKDALLYAKTA